MVISAFKSSLVMAAITSGVGRIGDGQFSKVHLALMSIQKDMSI